MRRRNSKRSTRRTRSCPIPKKRAAYDYELDHPGARAGGGFGGSGFSGFSGFGGGFSGFGDIFNDIFGGFSGSSSSSARAETQGEDITKEVVLSFLDAAKGCTKEVRYTRNEPCPSCKGTGAKNGTAYKTCDKCGGSGQVRYAQDTLFGRTIRVATCDACGGTGKKNHRSLPRLQGKRVRPQRNGRYAQHSGGSRHKQLYPQKGIRTGVNGGRRAGRSDRRVPCGAA